MAGNHTLKERISTSQMLLKLKPQLSSWISTAVGKGITIRATAFLQQITVDLFDRNPNISTNRDLA